MVNLGVGAGCKWFGGVVHRPSGLVYASLLYLCVTCNGCTGGSTGRRRHPRNTGGVGRGGRRNLRHGGEGRRSILWLYFCHPQSW